MPSKATQARAQEIIALLRKATRGMVEPASLTILKEYGRDPYLILISCLLSLRTKDTVSLPASQRLFNQAKTPSQMLSLSIATIEQLIYPTGFYRKKAEQLHDVSQELITRFNGKVPSTREELLSIKGIGRKTANLVLSVGFGIPAICVDVHVHRIANRLGIIQTETPEETEFALEALLPEEYWHDINTLFVMWGQNICVPVSPKCSECAVFTLCKRVGVTQRR
jgi:endonuclease-3